MLITTLLLATFLAPTTAQQSPAKGKDSADTAVDSKPDLVPLALPWVAGVEDDRPEQPRVVVEVHAHGAVRVHGGKPFEPDDENLWMKVSAAIEAASADWPTDENAEFVTRRGRVLVRCDSTSPFEAALQIMALSASLKTPIAGFDFACRPLERLEEHMEDGGAIPRPSAKLDSVIHYDLPFETSANPPTGDAAAVVAEGPTDLWIRVLAKGTKSKPATSLPWVPPGGKFFVYSDDRTIRYDVGPRRVTELQKLEETLAIFGRTSTEQPPLEFRIHTDRGVTYGEALPVIHALRTKAKAGSLTFTQTPD